MAPGLVANEITDFLIRVRFRDGPLFCFDNSGLPQRLRQMPNEFDFIDDRIEILPLAVVALFEVFEVDIRPLTRVLRISTELRLPYFSCEP